MVFHLFLAACFGIILPIMYFVLRHYGNPNGQQVFGVTIGSQHFEEEEIKKVQKQYIKEINRCGLISLAALIGCIFIKYESIYVTALMAWMFIICVAFEVPFMRANSKLKQLKAERGWNGELSRTVIVDTEVAKLQGHLLFKGCYIVSGILSILPIMIYLLSMGRHKVEWEILLVLGALSISSITMIVLGILLQKAHFKGCTMNSEINRAVIRTKRYHFGKGMAGTSLATAVFTVFLSIECYTGWKNMIIFICVTLGYVIFVCSYLFYMIYKAYKVKLKLVEGQEEAITEEDEYWIHGLFYYNKNDTNFMVEKRVGIGTTINMARPAAKVCMAILILILLSIPAFSVFMIGSEFSEIQLTITNEGIESSHFEGTYRINKDEIKGVEIITGYEKANKLVGTNTDYLYRGRYTVGDYGICKVCFDPRNHQFLVITTEDMTYILSDKTDEGTREAYDKLLLQLHKL